MHIRMEWPAIAFDWTQARAVLATIEEGSLSAAARALKTTQPTLGRQVAALEEQLGIALFDRTGRGLVPTPAALEIAGPLRIMAEAAHDVARLAAGRTETLDGLIRIAASEAEAVWLLPPALARLRAAHPGLRYEVLASTASADLRRQEADLALRNYRPTEPDLVARRIGTIRHRLFAAPALLDLHTGDLSTLPFIGFEQGPQLAEALRSLGLSLTPDSFALTARSQPVQWAMMRRGLGAGLMPEPLGRADPALTPLPLEGSIDAPLWLVAHRDLQHSRRLRAVADMLAGVLSDAT